MVGSGEYVVRFDNSVWCYQPGMFISSDITGHYL